MLLGHRVIQVACGSRDAQTLALTDEGIFVDALKDIMCIQGFKEP